MFLDTFYELVEKIELHDKIKAKKNLKFTKCIVVIVEPAGELPVGFIKFDSE